MMPKRENGTLHPKSLSRPYAFITADALSSITRTFELIKDSTVTSEFKLIAANASAN